jgi:hypothetical protein
MEDRRDMTNVLLAGLLGPVLHTADDTAWHSRTRRVTPLRCLGLPSDLDQHSELLQHLRMTQEAMHLERVRAAAADELARKRPRRHLHVVPDPPDAA